MVAKPVSATLDDERPRPDSPDKATFQHHLARYQFALRWIRPHHRVLETASGTGYGTQLLAGKAGFVIGTDYSPLAMTYANEHFSAPNLRYTVMDCQKPALCERTFDCIVSFEVFEHLTAQQEYLLDCHRLLKPGGLLLLSTPNRTTAKIHMNSITVKNEFHVGEVDLAALRRLLKPVFPQFEIYGQRRRGNRLYAGLRALDVFNLRLRLFSGRRREQLQGAMGVAPGQSATCEEWVFSRSQLRQCNHFVAVCRRAS